MNVRKVITAGVAVCAAVTLGACGSDDKPAAEPSKAQTSASSAAPANPRTDPSKPPSGAELNKMLNEALNPKIPNSKKVDLVQGSKADPSIFNKLIKAKKENPDVTYKIQPFVVKKGANLAQAKVKIKLPGRPESTNDFDIVYENGKWKLSKGPVCLLLSSGNEKSPMCKGS